MNSFGKVFRVSIFGESHGYAVGVLIDGCPCGMALSTGDFAVDLGRRMDGTMGTTPRRERDQPRILSGIFQGCTTGAPILMSFENRDCDSLAYEKTATAPRPGHADFTAARKYGGFNDHRGGGMFSGRLTAGIVAAGVVAKRILQPVAISAELVEAGGSTDISEAVSEALKQRDSIGGVVECRTTNVPVGLGEPFFDSVESLISHVVFSIPGIKAIEFGAGFGSARMAGSIHNDLFLDRTGKTKTNHAGGINGGITNGNELVFRVAVRPTASIGKPQRTIDMETGQIITLAVGGRHDTCFALRVPVIIEAAAAIVLADLALFGRATTAGPGGPT